MELSPDQIPSPAATLVRRRTVLFRWLTYSLGAVATVIVTIPFVGYILGIRKRPTQWISLGAVIDFPPDETRLTTFDNPIRQPWDGMAAHIGVYVRRQGEASGEQDQFLVLAANCAHLGCPVSWFPQSGLFMCPCHGGVYYVTGERASGPPPRGLFHCVWRVREGKLEIQAPHYPTLQNTLEESA
jgi:menaquinol-cytochrome c reductase iron-sulfur subunit